MSSNLSDQEQVQLLKNLWKKYGIYVVTGIIAFLLSSYGWRFWQGYQMRELSLASATFNKMLNEQYLGNNKEAALLAEHLVKEHKGSIYASLASLIEAREAVESGQWASAEKMLSWVIKNSKQNSMRQIARIRLARVFLEEKKMQEAGEVLDKIEDEAFLADAFEAKGDALFAQDKKDEALVYYKKALAINNDSNVQAPLLVMKLQQF